MHRRPEHLATGYVRAAALLVLLTGIAVMHVFVVVHTPAHLAGHPAAQSISDSPPQPPATATVPGVMPMAASGSAGAVPMTERHTPRTITATAAVRDNPGAIAAAEPIPMAMPSTERQIPLPTAARKTPGGSATVPAGTTAPMTARHGPAAATTVAIGVVRNHLADMTAVIPAAMTSMVMPGGHAHTGAGCADDCCTMRGGMHACVFILTALVLVLGLALLGRIGGDAHAPARAGSPWTTRRARPPPRTTLSLAELSILRI